MQYIICRKISKADISYLGKLQIQMTKKTQLENNMYALSLSTYFVSLLSQFQTKQSISPLGRAMQPSTDIGTCRSNFLTMLMLFTSSLSLMTCYPSTGNK